MVDGFGCSLRCDDDLPPTITVSPMLQLQPCRHDSLCYGYRWRILDETALARGVAWILVGQYTHANSIIRRESVKAPFVVATAKQQAIRRLKHTTSDTAIAHRDGWLFQHISWIAAIHDSAEPVAASAPHQQPASKGFDVVLIPLAGKRRAKLEIIIGEDKATTDPRSMIRDHVWPEIRKLEAGERDADVQSSLTLLIAAAGITNKEELSTAAFWKRQKRYRVSITVSPDHTGDAERRELFDGYDVQVPGAVVERRKAETLLLKDLRGWMENFSAKVIAEITKL